MGKGKALAVDLDVEQFIQNIQERPVIWDRYVHVQKPVVYQMWKELSRIHGLPGDTLKAKWKGLRDNFRVEFKRIPRNENDELLLEAADFDSKWTYYKHLLFLTDHMRSRNSKNNDTNNSNQSESNNLGFMCGTDLIQIPDEPHHQNNYEDEDDSTTDDDDNDNKLLEVADKHLPLNMTIRRRNESVPMGAAATVAQPILMLDEFLKSKALPAKKRKLAIVDEFVTNTAQVLHKVNTSKPNGSESPFYQQPVSTSTPVVGALRMDNGDSNSSPGFSAAMLQLGGSGGGVGGGCGIMPAGGSTPTAPIDDDYHFLLSLHPYMGKLNDTQKLRLRMKIQGLVYEELYSEY